jgi:hypothetical protein
MPQHPPLDIRIELGQRIVEEQDGRASDSGLHRSGLGQAERQHEEPLLTARAEAPHVVAVQLHHQIIPVRPDERQPPPYLVLTTRRQRLEELPFRRLRTERGAILEADRLVRSRQLRVEARDLAFEGIHGLAPPREDLHAGLRQLLIPGLEMLALPSLKEVIAPSQDLAVASVGRPMRRLDLGREAIHEIPPCLGAARENGQVLPAKRDGARPRAPFARHGPSAVLALGNAATDFPRDLASHHGATQRCAGGSPARKIRGLGASEGASHE